MRRAGAYAIAAALHAGVLALLLLIPPAAYEPVRRAVNAVEVRLYTVAGGADADSDAPLFEPPMDASPDASEPAGAVIEAPAPAAIDPAEAAEPEPDRAPAEAPAESPSELAADTPEPAAPGAERLGGSSTTDAPASGASAADADEISAPPAVRDPGVAVSTTQLDPPERSAVRAARPPSFADILARAQTRLDPEDFQVAQLLGGVRGATQESFCLSSASGNRDAMDCPDEPNAASAELARYALMGLGEEAPDFMEDMSRLEFQLRTLGADDGAIARILLGLRESRREVINAGPLRRQMNRDGAERDIDNLGNPRMGVPMPDNPGG